MDTQALPVGYRESKHTDDTFTIHAEVPLKQHDLPEHLALAQSLGLGDAYVDKFAPGTFTDSKRWQPCRLSLDEWLVVQCYFPKRYGFEGDNIGAFAFQELPEPVLRVWKEAKESGFFPNFQLRTTEGQGPSEIPSLALKLDPILIGFHTEGYRAWPYRLAQFGMDDPVRASMQNMARAVRLICLRRVKADKNIDQLHGNNLKLIMMLCALLWVAAVFMVLAIGALFEKLTAISLSPWWLLLALPLPNIFFVGGRLYRIWRVKHYGIKVLRPLLRKRLEAIKEAAAAKRILASA